MPETPHLSPLPSREGGGGSMRSRRLRGVPQTSEAAGRRDHVSKLLVAIWVLAVAARLVLINQPYVDHWSWRQSDVAAIARNFHEGGFRFAYPQIDWAGDATGYVGTEFPILPFVAAICYKFAGIHEWIGRSQAVIFFAVSLPFFFLLVREIFDNTAAVWATFFFSFAPLNVFAGRSFMPDVPSLGLAIIGLYFCLRWIYDRESVQFFIAARFYPHHLFGAGGIHIESFPWYWGIARQTATSGLTPVLVIMALIGLFVPPRSKPARSASDAGGALQAEYSLFFHWWLAGMILFIIVVGYGNRHPWYQLPLVPIAAALAGVGCTFFRSKISGRSAAIPLSILLARSFAILSYLYVRPLYESSAGQLRDAGLELNGVTAPGALIVAVDTGDPTIFCYAQRKGWHFLEKDGIYAGVPSDSQEATANLEELHRRGATHVVFTANTFWWLDYYPEFAQHLAANAALMEATPEFKIYRLTATAR